MNNYIHFLQQNERLEAENIDMKESGRKENFTMDTKIAAVAVSKASIQHLEKVVSGCTRLTVDITDSQ